MVKTQRLKTEREIGYHINRIMLEQNIGLDQLAGRTKIEKVHLEAILTGSVYVEKDELKKVAAGLNVDQQALLEPVSDEALQNYNVHCMGIPTCVEGMNQILDKIDMYVRLLGAQSGQ